MLISDCHCSSSSKPFFLSISRAATPFKPSIYNVRTGAFSPVNAAISPGGSQLLRTKQLLWVVSPISLNSVP